jgi:hypothetical protein
MRMLGIVLIIAGALALYFQEIPYKRREKVLDLGPLQATATKEESIPLPPWVGGGAIAVGVLMLAFGGSGGRRR